MSNVRTNFNMSNGSKAGHNHDGHRLQGFQISLEQQLASQQKQVTHRRTVDHGNPIGRWVLQRSMGINKKHRRLGKVRPEISYLLDLLPPAANKDKHTVMDIQTKFVHLSANKDRHVIGAIKWTPEGRRLISANRQGEFTLWNGMTFNFETIMQAHDTSVNALCYSHNDDWLVSADIEGVIKFWQPNFNNVNIIKGHEDTIRDISFSPNDSRFVTCSDDKTLKIWNFNTGAEERVLTGHNWDVKTCDWHPNLGLIVSGSKDNSLKLWDPRVSKPINTLLGFKHNVSRTRFQPSGTQKLIASVSKDQSCRIFDIRAMKDLLIIKSHEIELTSVAWHPIHSSIVTTGGYDGSMNHYVINSNQFKYTAKTDGTQDNAYQIPSIDPVHRIPYAHEKGITGLEYHPLGHVLCSASVDTSTRFWCRSRPNDPTAFNDELYTNLKSGAWHYAINNNINGSRALPTPSIPSTEKLSGDNS